MSNQPKRKFRLGINLNDLGAYVKETPKAVTEKAEYGKTAWLDATEWEDGNISLTGYNAETQKRYKVGVGKPATQNQNQSTQAQPTSGAVETDDDLPF